MYNIFLWNIGAQVQYEILHQSKEQSLPAALLLMHGRQARKKAICYTSQLNYFRNGSSEECSNVFSRTELASNTFWLLCDFARDCI